MLSTKNPQVFCKIFMINCWNHIMFPFVVLKVLFQIIRNICWHTQTSIIIYKQNVLIFTAFFVRNLFRVMFISNISNCIVTVWNFRSINNISVCSLDKIIFLFLKDCNVSPNHCFNGSSQFLTFTDSHRWELPVLHYHEKMAI